MPANDTQRLAKVRLARSQGIGPVTFTKLIEMHGDAVNAIDALLDGPHARKVASLDQAKAELAAAAKIGAATLCLGDSEYPERLAAIADAPPLLHCLGNLSLLEARIVAVVGARNASGAGLKLTRSIVGGLGEAGVCISSGLARGIDTAAHAAALDTGTIACLAGGLDVIYPPENKQLYENVIAKGLLVSEMPIGTKPQARHFPRRNRIISGLSDGVLVIEAATRSGSLITARLAGEQGRDIFAVPGSPLDPRSAGANRLIKDGAILARNAEDIISELTSPTLHKKKLKPAPAKTRKTTALQAPHQASSQATSLAQGQPNNPRDLMTILSPSPIHIDEIVLLKGGTADTILAELQLLELDGKVARHSGGRFSRIV